MEVQHQRWYERAQLREDRRLADEDEERRRAEKKEAELKLPSSAPAPKAPIIIL